jgi:hypothetical protein
MLQSQNQEIYGSGHVAVACSLELSAAYFQPASSIFLWLKISG